MSKQVSGVTMHRNCINVRASMASRDEVEWMIGALTAAMNMNFPVVATYRVVIHDHGERKINVIKQIREITGCGLKEARDFSEIPGSVILAGVDRDVAYGAYEALMLQGASASVEVEQ